MDAEKAQLELDKINARDGESLSRILLTEDGQVLKDIIYQRIDALLQSTGDASVNMGGVKALVGLLDSIDGEIQIAREVRASVNARQAKELELQSLGQYVKGYSRTRI